jgi:hypothetical protein
LKVEGQEPILSNHLIVWDKNTEKITCFWQRSDDEQGTTDWHFEGDTLVGKVRSWYADGTQGSVTVYHQPKGKDATIWWATDSIRDGKEMPDIGKFTHSRIE